MSLFSCRKIKKNFEKEVILEEVNIDFPSHGIVTIMGPSGCGKSTLINCLLGLETFDGKVYFLNQEIKNFEEFRNKYAGIIFQKFYLFEYLTVKENIELFKNKSELTKVIKLLDLKDKLNRKVSLLSGGEKQRVAIARTLMKNPRIIFCDEITGSLDEKNANKIMKYLKKISEEILIINISHNKLLADKYSDLVLTFKDKKINHFSSQEIDFKKSKNLKKLSLKSLLISSENFMKKSIYKIILSSFSLAISLSLFGIVLNINRSLSNYFDEYKKSNLDYQVIELSINKETKVENTSFSLVKQTRPTQKELDKITHLTKNCFYGYNFANLLNSYTLLTCNNEKISFEFRPTLSSEIKSYNQLITNEKGYELLRSNNVLYQNKRSIEYINSKNEIINDVVDLNIQFKVIKINHEMSFMQEAIFYYSYSLMEEYLCSIKLDNLTKELNKPTSLGQRIILYNYDGDFYDTGSIFLMCKDKNKVEEIYKKINKVDFFDTKMTCTNRSLEKYYLLNNLLSSITNAVDIFLFLSLVISLFLLGICINSLIIDEQKEIGVLKSLGILKKQVNHIIKIQVNTILLISFLFSFSFKLLVYYFINLKIPFLNLLNYNSLIFENSIVLYLLIIIGFIFTKIGQFMVNKIKISNVLREE